MVGVESPNADEVLEPRGACPSCGAIAYFRRPREWNARAAPAGWVYTCDCLTHAQPGEALYALCPKPSPSGQWMRCGASIWGPASYRGTVPPPFRSTCACTLDWPAVARAVSGVSLYEPNKAPLLGDRSSYYSVRGWAQCYPQSSAKEDHSRSGTPG